MSMSDKNRIFVAQSNDNEYLYQDHSGNLERMLYRYYSQKDAQNAIERAGRTNQCHVVELIEAPAKVVVPEWFDKWLDAFHDADPHGRLVSTVGRIAQQGWGANANQPVFGKASLDDTVAPRLSGAQQDYIYNHKQELMLAAMTGDYTVEKPKRWNVKVPHTKFYYWKWKPNDPGVGSGEDDDVRGVEPYRFTLAEIDHYDLQDCEKREVKE